MPAKIISLNRSSYCYKNRYGECRICFFVCIENVEDTACVFALRDILRRDENHFCLKKRV